MKEFNGKTYFEKGDYSFDEKIGITKYLATESLYYVFRCMVLAKVRKKEILAWLEKHKNKEPK